MSNTIGMRLAIPANLRIAVTVTNTATKQRDRLLYDVVGFSEGGTAFVFDTNCAQAVPLSDVLANRRKDGHTIEIQK